MQPSRIMTLLTRIIPLLVLLTLSVTTCTSNPTPPLHIATNTWPGYEPLYLAKNLGYLNDKSVKLYEMPNASDVIKAFRNKTVDVAALTFDEALLLIQDGIDARVLFVADISNGADVVLVKPGIKEIRDLKGKRVAVESLALGAYMLSRALEKAGLSADDVTAVPTTVDMHEQAYLSGKVDAVVTFEPVRTRLLNRGARAIFDSSMIPNEIVDVVVVRTEILEAYPDRVEELERGWFKAVAYLRGNPDDAYARMAKREGMSAEQFKDAVSRIIIPDSEHNRRLLERDLLPVSRRLADQMLRAKLLRSPVDPERLLDRSHRKKQ